MVEISFLVTDRLRYVMIVSIPDNINHQDAERKLFLKKTYGEVLNLKLKAIIARERVQRNLWALALYFDYARRNNSPNARDLLVLAATANLPGLSIMNQYIPGATFPTKVLKGTYYVPPMRQIENVWRRMESKVKGLCRSLDAINQSVSSNKLIISTEDARDLQNIRNNSIDHIFTDPPYSWKVQFGEANFLWESWLKLDTNWLDDEIIVNEARGKTEAKWSQRMHEAIAECYRVLKPGRWLSLCYHDTSEGTWTLVQDIMAEVGFIPDQRTSALFIDAREKSQKQIVADKTTKRDLVINFRKPRLGELSSDITITSVSLSRLMV